MITAKHGQARRFPISPLPQGHIFQEASRFLRRLHKPIGYTDALPSGVTATNSRANEGKGSRLRFERAANGPAERSDAAEMHASAPYPEQVRAGIIPLGPHAIHGRIPCIHLDGDIVDHLDSAPKSPADD